LKAIAILLDRSEYSEFLERDFLSTGVKLEKLENPSRIPYVLTDEFSGIVLVNPSISIVKEVRNVLDEEGGWFLRLPLIVALDDIDFRESAEVLKEADDFVVKPAGAKEILLRLRILSLKREVQGDVLSFGDLVINLTSYQVFISGKPVDFTYKEFELLKLLASNPGRAFRREDLLRKVWGYDYFGGARTVDVHIRRIRHKIEREGQTFIRTVRGVGYLFEFHES